MRPLGKGRLGQVANLGTGETLLTLLQSPVTACERVASSLHEQSDRADLDELVECRDMGSSRYEASIDLLERQE